MVKSLKVKCIVTGKESLFSGEYLRKKIEEYNEIDFKSTYILHKFRYHEHPRVRSNKL